MWSNPKMKRGFTLIELIMVIVILGILAAVAIPKFTDLSGRANEAAEQGVVGGVRAGISTYHAAQDPPVYPTDLDSASDGDCSATNVCFNVVLSQGGITTDDWSKSGAAYDGPFTGGPYTYDSADGSFE